MNRRAFVKYSIAGLFCVHPLFQSARASTTGQWIEQAAALPIPLQEIYPTIYKKRLFVAGGIASKLGIPYFSDQCYSFDPSTNQWQQEAELPHGMHHATLVSNGERLFLLGGFHGAYHHIWRMQDSVYELQDGQWVLIDKLPMRLAEGVLSCAADGAIHWVSGQTPKASANRKRSDHHEIHQHFRWDCDRLQWQKLAPIPTARNSATGAWVGDQLIISGGRTAQGNLAATEIYDANTDQWRKAAPLPLPQAGSASVAVEDGIIVFGGEIFIPKAKVFQNVWRYSIQQDRWTALSDMPTPRHGLGAGRFNDKIYLLGGATGPSNQGTSNLNEVYQL